jgi:hypothetical protein
MISCVIYIHVTISMLNEGRMSSMDLAYNGKRYYAVEQADEAKRGSIAEDL